LQAIIDIPVYVHLVDDTTGKYTTIRQIDGIDAIFDEVNRIWEPAHIRFVPNDTQRKTIPNAQLVQMIDRNGIQPPAAHDKGIDAYYVDNLDIRGSRVNGFSCRELRRIFVKDKPSVHVYRCTAHELGHVFGLNHEEGDDQRLMASNVNGEELTDTEITFARDTARLLN